MTINASRRLLVAITLSILAVLAITPLSAQDTTVTMVVTRDPVSLDPHGTLDPGAPVILAYIYDTLVYQDQDGSIQPNLATDWEVSEDQRSITFELQSDIVFSDGSPLNADAVIYTFQRLQELAQRSLIYSDISNISEFERVDADECAYVPLCGYPQP